MSKQPQINSFNLNTSSNQEENHPNKNDQTESEDQQGFGLGAMLLTAGLSAAAGALLAYFSTEEEENSNRNVHAQQHAQRTVPVQPPNDCTICCDSLGSAPMEQLPCSHLFHRDCLWRWLSDWQKSCPVCRLELTRQQFDIYAQRK